MSDPITALRDAPVPPVEFDATATHARIDALARERRGRRRRAPILAFAAAAVAAATVVTTGGSPTSTQPETASAVLRELSKRAGEQPPVTLGPGEYAFTRIIQRSFEGEKRSSELRYWTGADRKGREVVIVDRATVRDRRLESVPHALIPVNPPVPELASLPTEPTALAARMKELAERAEQAGDGISTHDYVSTAIGLMIDNRETPPEALRALYRFLSELPGIRLIGDVEDPLGRPGKALAVDAVPDFDVGYEMILDVETGRPLAFMHYQGDDVNDRVTEMTREDAVVEGDTTLP